MLQKYFPIVGEINSPLAAMAALGFTSAAAEIAVAGISNSTLESLLWAEVENTEARKTEIATSMAELEEARTAAKKAARYYRYRAAIAARSARVVSKLSRRIKASKRPATKASLRGLSGLNIDICRQRAANAQTAVRSAVTSYNAALEAVELAVNKGGDTRVIRTCVAALKEAVRTLEVRHVEFKFAREMLSIALARHSA